MNKESTKWKKFNMRIEPEIFMHIKVTAAQMEVSMTELVLTCIRDHKKSLEILEEHKKMMKSLIEK